MLIDDAIKALQDLKEKGETAVIIAWWEADEYNMKDNEDWPFVAEQVEDRMDWGNVGDEFTDLVATIFAENPTD